MSHDLWLTWTVGLVHRFKVAQRAIELGMLGISLMDLIRTGSHPSENLCDQRSVLDSQAE